MHVFSSIYHNLNMAVPYICKAGERQPCTYGPWDKLVNTGPPSLLQCVYSKWGHSENTNQSHCRTEIEKINKRRIGQSVLGKKQFEQINESQTVKIDLKSITLQLMASWIFLLIGRALVWLDFSFCSAMRLVSVL
jgi:hypothetical protein